MLSRGCHSSSVLIDRLFDLVMRRIEAPDGGAACSRSGGAGPALRWLHHREPSEHRQGGRSHGYPHWQDDRFGSRMRAGVPSCRKLLASQRMT